jgi:hypothetical protein
LVLALASAGGHAAEKASTKPQAKYHYNAKRIEGNPGTMDDIERLTAAVQDLGQDVDTLRSKFDSQSAKWFKDSQKSSALRVAIDSKSNDLVLEGVKVFFDNVIVYESLEGVDAYLAGLPLFDGVVAPGQHQFQFQATAYMRGKSPFEKPTKHELSVKQDLALKGAEMHRYVIAIQGQDNKSPIASMQLTE